MLCFIALSFKLCCNPACTMVLILAVNPPTHQSECAWAKIGIYGQEWIKYKYLPITIRANSGSYLPKNLQNSQNGLGHKWGCPSLPPIVVYL